MSTGMSFEEQFELTPEEAGIDDRFIQVLIAYAEANYTDYEVKMIKKSVGKLPNGFMDFILLVGWAESNKRERSDLELI